MRRGRARAAPAVAARPSPQPQAWPRRGVRRRQRADGRRRTLASGAPRAILERMRPRPRHETTAIASAALCLAVLLTASATASAEDITTLDGKHYLGVANIVDKSGGITFTADGAEVHVPFRKLPLDVQLRHHHNPLELGLDMARLNAQITVDRLSGFSLKDLEKAKAKAVASGRPLGFVMVWQSFFEGSCKPMGEGGNAMTAHFIEAWSGTAVLVFVFHETELGQVPPAVKLGFGGPDEGGWAPNLCVTDSTATDYICEIPCGGHSDGKAREDIFRKKLAVIATWLETHPLANPHGLAAMAASASPAGSATTAAVASAPAPAAGQAKPPPPAGTAPAPKPSASGVDEEP